MKTKMHTVAAVETYQELENNYRTALAEFADDKEVSRLDRLMHRILIGCKEYVNQIREQEGVTMKEYYTVCTGQECPF